MFNIKIIAAESFTFILWIVLLFRFFLSDNPRDIIINGVIFGVTILLGILLVKSVEEEVLLQESLKIANEGQTNLIHIMNHQVKGHLSVNKDIFAELLTDDYGEMPESAKSVIKKGLEESDMGVKYVTEILRGASAENGTLLYDMKKIDFKLLVLEAVKREKESIEKKGLSFDLKIDDGSYLMMGDAIQLREVVTNVIDNSVYYTPSGNIWVHLMHNGNTILLTVKDTGVGVKEGDRSKLFKSGGVGSNSIKINIRSSGYGLAFVKGVVEAHKGKVWFESEGENKGTTFFVELPAV